MSVSEIQRTNPGQPFNHDTRRPSVADTRIHRRFFAALIAPLLDLDDRVLTDEERRTGIQRSNF
jgi:hypothetical protein